MNMKTLSLAIVATGALAIAGCSNDAADQEGHDLQASSRTLASVLADENSFSRVSGTLGDAGLSEVFDGTASYTILVPTDDAFAALGDAGEALQGDEAQAVMVAVIRDHILPGYFSPQDIATAIDAQGGEVSMTTMGETTVTFDKDGDDLTMRSADGSSARMSGEAIHAVNGVAIPVDHVLKQLAPES